MTNVEDIAAYILSKASPMSSMKLQKLVYYSQAWSLVWDEAELFPEKIRAWANGPVVYELFELHRGKFSVSQLARGNADLLSDVQRETVDAVLQTYGNLSGRQLSHLTHSEAPWQDARGDLPDTARSDAEITPDSLAQYYASLDAATDATNIEQLDWEMWLRRHEDE